MYMLISYTCTRFFSVLWNKIWKKDKIRKISLQKDLDIVHEHRWISVLNNQNILIKYYVHFAFSCEYVNK